MNKNKIDSIILDMPEVKDIPGQENITPPLIGEMADTTIASGGEEGEGLVDAIDKEPGFDDIGLSEDTNVSEDEKELLRQTEVRQIQELNEFGQLQLDQTDGEDLLNEEGGLGDMGSDLDIPGSELDDENEEIGEEDEENNNYSLPD